MNEFDIPIFQKTYDLYRNFYDYRRLVPKQDRYTIWQRSEDTVLDLIAGILLASQTMKMEKLPILTKASVNVSLLRVLIRLMKETKALDNKKYVALETSIDEIGRMLGGWIRSSKLGA